LGGQGWAVTALTANVCVFERTHESPLFCALVWFAQAALLAGIVKTATGKVCNECKTLGQLGRVCVKCSPTNDVFQTAIFFILVVRNNKRSSGFDGKTSDGLSRICLYYRYLELSFCQWLFSELS